MRRQAENSNFSHRALSDRTDNNPERRVTFYGDETKRKEKIQSQVLLFRGVLWLHLAKTFIIGFIQIAIRNLTANNFGAEAKTWKHWHRKMWFLCALQMMPWPDRLRLIIPNSALKKSGLFTHFHIYDSRCSFLSQSFYESISHRTERNSLKAWRESSARLLKAS